MEPASAHCFLSFFLPLVLVCQGDLNAAVLGTPFFCCVIGHRSVLAAGSGRKHSRVQPLLLKIPGNVDCPGSGILPVGGECPGKCSADRDIISMPLDAD